MLSPGKLIKADGQPYLAFQKLKPSLPWSEVDVTLEGVCMEALSQGWFRGPRDSKARDQMGVNRIGVSHPGASLRKSE